MTLNEAENTVLDLRGLKCPLPALYARRALERAAPGAAIVVLSDDPMAAVDLPHMCNTEGFSVLQSSREGQVLRIVLQRPA
ncbi:MAG TPA: sulfurtransferase TusA family protein [Rhizomicrobium sp.]|jgi:tRNA 2-thiouridine synthesizing protein A